MSHLPEEEKQLLDERAELLGMAQEGRKDGRFGDGTEEVIGALIEVHRCLGPGLLESGVAVGVWAEPRQTRDIDLCGARPLEEVDRLLALRAAVPGVLDGVATPVVTPENLLIHKLVKLRHDQRRVLQDLADVRAVVVAQGDRLDWSYIRAWARPEESAWLESVANCSDEEPSDVCSERDPARSAYCRGSATTTSIVSSTCACRGIMFDETAPALSVLVSGLSASVSRLTAAPFSRAITT